MASLPSVDDALFEEQVLRSTLPTVVEFWAEWCAPCRVMAPMLASLAEQYAGQVNFVQLDVQTNPETIARFSISAVPTMLLFVDGQLKGRLSGHVPPKKLTEWLSTQLG